ncbi:hypothetical protein DPMN_065472 [Dreissena polymorpha]|uniref:Uncharacterized protein n=1 Tax=Dreissena polymorpha TaxID=45954 RepID=A0A9D3YWJ4_DREPO|nr:hypothetical protein DPMN_065472 [Dreissena polymorpha]
MPMVYCASIEERFIFELIQLYCNLYPDIVTVLKTSLGSDTTEDACETACPHFRASIPGGTCKDLEDIYGRGSDHLFWETIPEAYSSWEKGKLVGVDGGKWHYAAYTSGVDLVHHCSNTVGESSAFLRWTCFNLLMLDRVCGSQTDAAYSSWGLTRDVYAFALMSV